MPCCPKAYADLFALPSAGPSNLPCANYTVSLRLHSTSVDLVFIVLEHRDPLLCAALFHAFPHALPAGLVRLRLAATVLVSAESQLVRLHALFVRLQELLTGIHLCGHI
eukprot:Plantae.Rhodophyta-Purpureofilum_apyrenoidigerum.ctg12967.p2 GENE.Plantae.Rhodophyta-Purpureofilum_apyrenoidigerum.ctg12967~~Plantae.Rhodophyta-Purpureofilum_apyrenoidigerum.ctg12967.p2  ORF type:complete len:109 (+),score=1.86 Plantae.Rhodophyta-Purpureofilum_apyrenoidigerum.ctg12967:584-910(+)